jgi:hypothetical protein
VASAIALGEIGGSDAAVALERSAIYDHREDVRKASTTALNRLNAKAQTTTAAAPPLAAGSSPPSLPAATTPPPSYEAAPDAQGSGAVPEALPQQGELTPPPPPTPVAPGGNTRGNP